MPHEKTIDFNLVFPGDLEYIPAVRKFVSDMLAAGNFSPKFAYRSEIIIDEICNNAVNFGCLSVDANVELACRIDTREVEFIIKDEGGRKEDVKKLSEAIKKKPPAKQPSAAKNAGDDKCLGLEIVRMISDRVDFQIDKNNITSVRVIKKRDGQAVETPMPAGSDS